MVRRMDIYSRNRRLTEQGFILPVTMICFLILIVITMSVLDQLILNQDALKEKQTLTACFIAFESARFDLCHQLDTTTDNTGSGTLDEYKQEVSFTYTFLSVDLYKVELQQKTPTGSSLTAWFVYNRKTKLLEKWVI